jgi:CelD/BcsL family acetyltransferase involved in cellulose biosynthesis
MDVSLLPSNDVAEWSELLAASPQGSIFSDARYMQSLAAPHTCYIARTPHGEALAGVAVIEDGGEMRVAPFPFTPYQGVFFGPSVAAQPGHKRVTSELRITKCIINSLIELYGNCSMVLSPAFADIRPFLWHNYHAAGAPRFSVENRYTAVLDLSNFDYGNYLKSIRAVRRQEVKKATVELSETDEVTLFIDIYAKTFERQGIVVSPQQLDLVRSITASALEHGYGRLTKATNADGVASMSLFVSDARCAYYLIGANNPEQRHTGASSALMVDNIRAMAEKGMSRLDFVGVNSPNRGDYKLSFNPDIVHYHEVHLAHGNSMTP